MEFDNHSLKFEFIKNYLKKTDDAFLILGENTIIEKSDNFSSLFSPFPEGFNGTGSSKILEEIILEYKKHSSDPSFIFKTNYSDFDCIICDFESGETLLIIKRLSGLNYSASEKKAIRLILNDIEFSSRNIHNSGINSLDKFDQRVLNEKKTVSYISHSSDDELPVKKWVLTRKIPVFEGSEISDIAHYSIDIDELILSRTEILGSEEYFRHVVNRINNCLSPKKGSIIGMALEASDIGVWIWDFENDIVTGDMPWHRFFRNRSSTENTDPHFIRKFETSIHPDDLEQVAVKLIDHLEGRTEYFEMDFRIYFDKFHEYRWVMDRGKVTLYDTQGKPSVIVGTFKDISERKELEYHLIKAKENAEKLSLMKSDFISNINHELRTPLTVIMGISETLIGIEEDRQKKDFLRKLLSSAENLFSVLNNLIEISKINSNAVISLSYFDPSEILKSYFNKYINQFRDKNILFSLNINSNVPAKIKWIPEYFGILIENLLENSLKFTERGFVNLNFRTSAFFNNMVEIEIILEDSGIGIENKYYGNLFDYFFQVDSSNTRKYPGTGMGLAICKEIADTAGGTITVDSEYGKGTVLTVKLKFEFIS